MRGCMHGLCKWLFVRCLPKCLQDVNKEAGAEDTFKAIGEAYEVSC
jgi:curved DNA-binding protein CbpA